MRLSAGYMVQRAIRKKLRYLFFPLIKKTQFSKTLYNYDCWSCRNKGVKVELGIPYELWDTPSAEVTDMQRKVTRFLISTSILSVLQAILNPLPTGKYHQK
jgi:hypothetical protein